MQSKTLSKTLLNNSQLSGVKLNALDPNLSDNGHGLYIESISGDRYVDLRLAHEKPFWGHTHPLMMQYQFSNQGENAQSDLLSPLSKNEFVEFLKDYQKISLADPMAEMHDQKLFISITEYDVLNGLNLSLLDQVCMNNEVVIEERDLILFTTSELFITHNIKSTKILSLSFLDYFYLNQPHMPQNLARKAERQLINSMARYAKFLLWGAEGKLKNDQNLIQEFVTTQKLNWELHSNYILIPETNRTSSQFLEAGIYISDYNALENKTALCIPAACTKAELLDTLERVLRVLKG